MPNNRTIFSCGGGHLAAEPLTESLEPINQPLQHQKSQKTQKSKDNKATQEVKEAKEARENDSQTLLDSIISGPSNTPNALGVYDLGRIEVSATESVDYNATATTITQEDMQGSLSMGMAQALRFTPGVFYTPGYQGGRGSVRIRGYSKDMIGIYIDGIPVHDIYDKNTDLDQFSTFGLSEISVSKGYTSPQYGVDTVGGAINMITSKPMRDLELSAQYMFISNNENRLNAMIGKNYGSTYFQLTYAYTQRDSVNYSKDGSSTGPTEISKTNYKNQNIRAKYGFQTENHEYSLNINLQKGEKNAGGTVAESGWHWPFYDKNTFYIIGNSAFSDMFSLNSRIYYDTKYDKLISGNGSSPSFNSTYDDWGMGIIETLSVQFNANQLLKLGLNVKNENHQRIKTYTTNLAYNAPSQKFSELNSSVFTEYSHRINDMFRFSLNGSYDRRDPLSIYTERYSNAQRPPEKDKGIGLSGFTAQAILYADLGEHTLLHANIGRKASMPSISSRYGRWGTNVPNDKLIPETAINYELGADFAFRYAQFGFAVYYNDVNNMLGTQQVDVQTADTRDNAIAKVTMCETPSGTAAGSWQANSSTVYCTQNTNVAEGYYYGGEAYAQASLIDDMLSLRLNYTYLQKKYFSNGRMLTNHPRNTFNGAIIFSPQREFDVTINGAFQTSNYAYSTALGYYKRPSYYVIDIRANWHLNDKTSLSFGAYNVLDKAYNVIFLETGRRLFASVTYRY